MKYRAEIDGLRAVAVVPVVLFHAGFAPFSGGFIGVDVFFVISGYLITSILIEDLDKGRFSILDFYERRARRILPALFFVVLVCIPFAWAWMLPSRLEEFARSVAATGVFSSNFLFWQEVSYFATAAEEKPLLHTWSLAVEEQYYVIAPVALFFAWRLGANAVLQLAFLLFLVSLALSEIGWRTSPSANFFLFPTRAWELLAGTMVAIWIWKSDVKSNDLLASLGLVAIVVSVFVFDEETPFPSLLTLLPVVGTSLLILFGSEETLAAKLLSTKALVGLGLISYSVYLWHQPLFAFARIKLASEPSPVVIATLILATFFLALLSWKFVEQPFRKRIGSSLGRKQIFVLSVFGILTLTSIGSLGHFLNGFSSRFTPPHFVVAGEFQLPSRSTGHCYFNLNRGEKLIGDAGTSCQLVETGSDKPSLLLFGDSFAAHWEPYLQEFAQQNEVNLSSVTTNWCFPSAIPDHAAPKGHPSREQCDFNRNWLSENFQNFDAVILAGSWDGVASRGFAAGVFGLIDEISEEAPVLILDVPPQLTRISVEAAIFDSSKPLVVEEDRMADAMSFQSDLENRYDAHSEILFLDQIVLGFERFGGFKNFEGYPYSLDGRHISIYGAKALFSHGTETATLDQLRNFLLR